MAKKQTKAEETKATPWEITNAEMAKYGYKPMLLTLGSDVTLHEIKGENAKSKTGVRARFRVNMYDPESKQNLDWGTFFAYPQSDKGIARVLNFKKGQRISGYVKIQSETNNGAVGTISMTGLFARPRASEKAKHADAE